LQKFRKFFWTQGNLPENFFPLEAVHKRSPQSGREGGLFSADIFRTRGEGGSSDADVRNFGAKNSGFFKIMACPHGQGGSIFWDFFADVFYRWPLIEKS